MTTTIPYLDNELLRKLDLLLQAVRQGKFDDTIKLVEFVDKLDGTELTNDMTMMYNAVDDLNDDATTLRNENNMLKGRVLELENKNNQLHDDMNKVAKALDYLFNPRPIEKAWELGDIRNFLQSKGIRIE